MSRRSLAWLQPDAHELATATAVARSGHKVVLRPSTPEQRRKRDAYRRRRAAAAAAVRDPPPDFLPG